MISSATGTKLTVGTTTPTDVGSLTKINGLELSAETIDTTTLDSEGGFREFVQGLKDGGEVAIEGLLDPQDTTGQIKVQTNFDAGTVDDYTIEFPTAMKAKWAFKAIVTGFSTGAELGSAVSFGATLKVTGKPTLTITA